MVRSPAALSTFLLALPVLAAAQPQRAPAVTLVPAYVVEGAPELMRVHAPAAKGVEGEWLGHKVEFFRGPKGDWVALAGVDVEAPAGSSTLHLTIHTSVGTTNLSPSIEIHAAHYRTGTLTVAPKFVEPTPEAMKEIEAERALKGRIFSISAPDPLWHGSFRAPVRTLPSDSFGTRRMFNGQLASIHKGADFHASTGTPVRASNSGVVVLARRLYFEGNCVVIDHGLGLYTISMHFSRIDVHEGERVRAGQILGLSGSTGRVTGPHLHWAVRWQDAYLDPVKLLKLNLSALP